MPSRSPISAKKSPLLLLGGLLFSTPSFGGATVINLGAEVGWSAAHNLSNNGRHFAVRTSYVDMEWSKGSERFMTPSKWKGMYARLERNRHDDRGVFGLGRSIGSDTLGLYGIEGGALVSKGQSEGFNAGAELTAFMSAALVGIYIRESVVFAGESLWQTDIGLRFMTSFMP